MSEEMFPLISVAALNGGSFDWQTEAEHLKGTETIGKKQHVRGWLCSGKNAENTESDHEKNAPDVYQLH